MNAIGVIPARYESSRFPGKPLVDILGKSMIQRVYEQCLLSKSLDLVIVATDDQRIFDAVESFGGRVKMTNDNHPSGTDRVAEVAADFEADDVIINIQGDEPTIDPLQIDQLVSLMQIQNAQIGTLARWIHEPESIDNPNVVKVVMDMNQRALYFSRAAIPYPRGEGSIAYRQHIGIYGYQNQVLQEITKLLPSPLEQAESLEQLRWLAHGYDIHIEMSDYRNIGVDTPEDVELIINLLQSS